MKDLIKNINNINVSKWLETVPYPYKKKDAIWWIDHCKEKEKEKPTKGYEFTIELKEKKSCIGGIALAKVNKDQGTATLGYWLGEDYWRKGYGSEALKAVLDFAFKKLKLRRLEAGVFTGNPSSGKLLEKFGAKMEGMKRKSKRCKADGKIKDEICYGLLKEEYTAE
jgi:RimJ/RimL family protein N-acetyltransferase